jgi:outer membrane lipoprotein SlyB
MRRRWTGAGIATAFAATAVLLAGCGPGPLGRMQAAPPVAGASYGEAEVRNGRIERIDPVTLTGAHQLGVGHVLGAVAGGALGHQFGGGKARVVAQVAGSLGGGYVGGQVQSTFSEPRPGQVITVTLANGVAVGITQPVDASLQVGDCVRIDGTGQSARVVRDSCAGVPPPDARPTGERLAAQFGPQGESARARIQARMRQPAAASGTATAPASSSDAALRMGRVESVEAVSILDADDLGLHQISNGVVGAAMGYQLPGGASREFADAARVLGGTGGAAPAPFTGPRPGQYVLVRLDNGIVVGISQLPGAPLAVGDRVRVEGAGAGARVVRT